MTASRSHYFPNVSMTTSDRTVLVQIGKQVEKLSIGRVTYRVDRTVFHTAGAVASLRPSSVRSNWPLRMRCVNSIPEIVVAALLNRLNPSITYVLDLMWRWSWSGSRTALLRYGPLRTVRAPLGAYGSSLYKGICRHPVAQLLLRRIADSYGN